MKTKLWGDSCFQRDKIPQRCTTRIQQSTKAVTEYARAVES
jgi:hypothetical protein